MLQSKPGTTGAKRNPNRGVGRGSGPQMGVSVCTSGCEYFNALSNSRQYCLLCTYIIVIILANFTATLANRHSAPARARKASNFWGDNFCRGAYNYS